MLQFINDAPPAFLSRYHAIMREEEVLDTKRKLRDFLLFVVEQGQPNREMREYIAELATEVVEAAPAFDNIPTKPLADWDKWGTDDDIFTSYEHLLSCTHLWLGHDDGPGDTVEGYADRSWHRLREAVDRIDLAYYGEK